MFNDIGINIVRGSDPNSIAVLVNLGSTSCSCSKSHSPSSTNFKDLGEKLWQLLTSKMMAESDLELKIKEVKSSLNSLKLTSHEKKAFFKMIKFNFEKLFNDLFTKLLSKEYNESIKQILRNPILISSCNQYLKDKIFSINDFLFSISESSKLLDYLCNQSSTSNYFNENFFQKFIFKYCCEKFIFTSEIKVSSNIL